MDGEDDDGTLAELDNDNQPFDNEEMEAMVDVDADQKVSNNAEIEEVAEEVEQHHILTRKDVNLGWFAITKVSDQILIIKHHLFLFFHCSLRS